MSSARGREKRELASVDNFDEGFQSTLASTLPAPTPWRARSWLVRTTEVVGLRGVCEVSESASEQVEKSEGKYGEGVLEKELLGGNS